MGADVFHYGPSKSIVLSRIKILSLAVNFSLMLPSGSMGYKYVDSSRSADFVALSKSVHLSSYVEIYQVY